MLCVGLSLIDRDPVSAVLVWNFYGFLLHVLPHRSLRTKRTLLGPQRIQSQASPRVTLVQEHDYMSSVLVVRQRHPVHVCWAISPLSRQKPRSIEQCQ